MYDLCIVCVCEYMCVNTCALPEIVTVYEYVCTCMRCVNVTTWSRVCVCVLDICGMCVYVCVCGVMCVYVCDCVCGMHGCVCGMSECTCVCARTCMCERKPFTPPRAVPAGGVHGTSPTRVESSRAAPELRHEASPASVRTELGSNSWPFSSEKTYERKQSP